MNNLFAFNNLRFEATPKTFFAKIVGHCQNLPVTLMLAILRVSHSGVGHFGTMKTYFLSPTATNIKA